MPLQYLQERLDRTKELPAIDSIPLLFNILETLSKIAYPKKGNGEKFKLLMKKYSNWGAENKVCIVHIQQAVKLHALNTPNEFNEYFDKINGVFFESSHSNPTLDQIAHVWDAIDWKPETSKEVRNINNYLLTSLLWSLRNRVTHEYNFIANSHKKDSIKVHYYQIIVSGISHYRIYFPFAFLHTLASELIDAIKESVKTGELSLDGIFDYGDFLIKDLNNE
ncbi:MAG: hypothetical protein OCD01_19510 [Fibrobacterales bacterium]